MAQSNEWDFSKLPADKHQIAIEALGKKDTVTLITIHDRYQLSNYSYCCGKDAPLAVLRWFSWAYQNGLINASKKE